MKFLLCAQIVVFLQWPAFADQEMKAVLDNIMSAVPTPCAVWIETYQTHAIDSYPFFSPVLVKSGDAAEYRVAESQLIVTDSKTGTVWCYFLVLATGAELSFEVTSAKGAIIRYTSESRSNLPVAEVRSRIQGAETMLLEYAQLENQMESIDLSAALIFFGVGTLFAGAVVSDVTHYGQMNWWPDSLYVGLSAVFFSLPIMDLIRLVANPSEMLKIRHKLQELWD